MDPLDDTEYQERLEQRLRGPHLTPEDDETLKLVNQAREEGDQDE